MQNRRTILGVIAAGGAALLGLRWMNDEAAMAETKTFEITKTSDQWKKQLTPAQYNVLRNAQSRHRTARHLAAGPGKAQGHVLLCGV